MSTGFATLRCITPDDPNIGPPNTFGNNTIDAGASLPEASAVQTTDARAAADAGGEEPRCEHQGPPVFDP